MEIIAKSCCKELLILQIIYLADFISSFFMKWKEFRKVNRLTESNLWNSRVYGLKTVEIFKGCFGKNIKKDIIHTSTQTKTKNTANLQYQVLKT